MHHRAGRLGHQEMYGIDFDKAEEEREGSLLTMLMTSSAFRLLWALLLKSAPHA